MTFSIVHNISDPKVLEQYYNSTWKDVWFFPPRPHFEQPFHTVICMVWTPPRDIYKFANMSLMVLLISDYLAFKGSLTLTRFFGPEKNRVKGKMC